MPDNRRRLTRHKLRNAIDVWDGATGKRLGQLVNLHQEGLMVLGDFAFAENTLYTIKLKLPQTIGKTDVLMLGVDCLWVRADSDTELQWSGFQIIDSSDEQAATIQRVITHMTIH